ncbi:ATP-grasp peptide maturase system methyltransferase [Catellatospora sp. KI3]|uniref:ATP-grasp peptide maturase system methyltransferase n=1 Tax=Catellatospora sp. KI3 TaxID=3041620 RepID=UPI0024826A65|nr:ATP-grasp peptide maturase system methyltransferase [Catellatospora sp. KI3]MDI1462540.1 ATP-grasp peptide maturase system methyltransferase [Catellatospora sp. KI3]
MSSAEIMARTAYVRALADGGHLDDEHLVCAFQEVPRHGFLPAFFLWQPDGRWRGVDRREPDYLRLVYADTALATQLDGETTPDPKAPARSGTPTCGSTRPSLMATMLEALALTGRERVLEVGLGTGYNAALLSHRLGDSNVYSVDVDGAVVEAARSRLNSCGCEPHIATTDGRSGWPGSPRFDRLIATCAVPAIPPDWIFQVADGGLIVASLWRGLGGGPLVRLEVDHGTAQGRFLSMPGDPMPVRTAARVDPDAAWKAAAGQTGATHTTPVPPDALDHPHASLWVSLLVPDAGRLDVLPEDGSAQLWLLALDGSWSCLDTGTNRVEQRGPRRLWDEVEQAYSLWRRQGEPARERTGLTVTRDGLHRIWLDHPSNAAVDL